jgi:hypothetical protein
LHPKDICRDGASANWRITLHNYGNFPAFFETFLDLFSDRILRVAMRDLNNLAVNAFTNQHHMCQHGTGHLILHEHVA